MNNRTKPLLSSRRNFLKTSLGAAAADRDDHLVAVLPCPQRRRPETEHPGHGSDAVDALVVGSRHF